MTSLIFGLGFSLITALVVILGDTAIKHAADSGHTALSRLVLVGVVLYAVSALLWFVAMRHVTLAQAGVAYSMFSLIALCLIGAVLFDEPIRLREGLGILVACVAMILMIRVA